MKNWCLTVIFVVVVISKSKGLEPCDWSYDNCAQICYTLGNFDTRDYYSSAGPNTPPVDKLDCISIGIIPNGSATQYSSCSGCVTSDFFLNTSYIWANYGWMAGSDGILQFYVIYMKDLLSWLNECDWKSTTLFNMRVPSGIQMTVPDYCPDATVDALPQYVNQTGGVWSGLGVNGNNELDPGVLSIGMNTVMWSITDPLYNNCVVSKIQNFDIIPLPAPIILNQFPVGVSVLDGQIDLWNYMTSLSVIYSGPGTTGINGRFLDYCVAGVGTHTITATQYNVFTGCTGTISQDITIGPVVTFNVAFPDSVSTGGNTLNLYNYVGPSSGGSFSGNGVWWSMNLFVPGLAGIGTHLITYNACGIIDTQSIKVVGDPGKPKVPELVEGTVFYYGDGGLDSEYRGRVCFGDTVHLEVIADTMVLTVTWFDELLNVIGTGYQLDYVVNTMNPWGVTFLSVEVENWINEKATRTIRLETMSNPQLYLIHNNPDTICVKDTIGLEISFLPQLYYDFTYDTLVLGQYGPYPIYDTTVMQVRKFVWFDDLGNVLDTVHAGEFDTIYETIIKTNYISVTGGPVAACVGVVDTNALMLSINRVVFGGFDNWMDGYDRVEKDYSCEQTASVVRGQSYNLYIRGLNMYNVGVWIDYNNDGAFSLAEMIVWVANSGNVYSQTHTIPMTAVTNQLLRMRIISEFINPFTGPCMNSEWGTIQDYSVLVSDTGSSTDSIYAGVPKVTCGEVKFSDVSGDYVNSMFWDFGDGNTSTERNPEYTYANAGNYTITLTREIVVPKDSVAVFNYVLSDERRILYVQTLDDYSSDPYACYCTSSGVDTIVLNKIPDIDFSLGDSSGCDPLLVWVNDQSLFVDQYEWVLGNGDTDTVVAPIVTYGNNSQVDSIYTIQLNATALYGCKDTFSIPVEVYPIPVADFTISDSAGCSPFDITFQNTSNIGTYYNWNLGDGTVSDSLDSVFVHTYNNNDSLVRNHLIKLVILTNRLCADTAYDSVVVYPVLIADFTTTNDTVISVGDLIKFTNSSIYGDTYEWDFGDNVVSYDEDAWHYFNIPGVYDIGLIITNQYGCKDTIIRSSYITVTNGVGISEELKEKIMVYPNPVVDRIVVELRNEENLRGRIYLQDVTGKGVYYSVELDGRESLYELNVEGIMERGVYLLNIEIEGEGRAIYKIIKL